MLGFAKKFSSNRLHTRMQLRYSSHSLPINSSSLLK